MCGGVATVSTQLQEEQHWSGDEVQHLTQVSTIQIILMLARARTKRGGG